MGNRAVRTTAGDKTICLPMPPDIDYKAFVEDTAAYRSYLDQMIQEHPELFPAEIIEGYGVPYDGIAHVLGHSAMYWYNITQSLGRISIVGATVKDPSAIPPSPGGR